MKISLDQLLELLIVVIALVVTTPGCKKDEGSTVAPPVTPTTGSLEVFFFIFPTRGNVVSCQITLLGTGKVYYTNDLNSYTVEDLMPGTYNISVDGLDPNSVTIAQGSATDIVKAGKTVQVDVVLEPIRPPTPSGLSVSRSSLDNITLSWNSSAGAQGYGIYRSMTSGYGFTLIDTTSSTFWIDQYVDAARWYYYKVTAYVPGLESNSSSEMKGYRKGWRFDNIVPMTVSGGVGLRFDEYAFGFQNNSKAISIYAVYEYNSLYYYVPGTGAFNYAAYVDHNTPPSDTAIGIDFSGTISASYWDPSWKNNQYPQYINIRIYKTYTISTLYDDWYAQTGYYPIYWSDDLLNPRPVIGKKLSIEEVGNIERRLQKNDSQLHNRLLKPSIIENGKKQTQTPDSFKTW
jgi:hypothetical protein